MRKQRLGRNLSAPDPVLGALCNLICVADLLFDPYEIRIVNAWPIRQFVFSCGLLLLPVLAWNAALTEFLPPAITSPASWDDIPAALAAAESSLRLLVFALPFFMPLSVSSTLQRKGLVIFIGGILVYFASWLALIAAPNSQWANSSVGFLAPAYTPMIWLAGLAVLGQRVFFVTFYRWWMYLALSAIFMAAHVSHAVVVYVRNY